jgi:hypothetical protein
VEEARAADLPVGAVDRLVVGDLLALAADLLAVAVDLLAVAADLPAAVDSLSRSGCRVQWAALMED